MMRKFLFCAVLGATAAACRADLDLSAMDRSVKPQDDFFRYANGTWLKTTPIPPQYPYWGASVELRDATAQNLRVLCERASAVDTDGTPAERLVGNFYASALDTGAIQANGADPLRFEFDRIDALRTPAQVFLEIAHLQDIGVDAGLDFTSTIDPTDTSTQIADLSQSGLSLPDRDYYFRPSDAKFRQGLVAHIQRMFGLLGISAADAQATSSAILSLETGLAQVSSTRVALRDPIANTHKLRQDELARLTPGLDWKAFFAQTEAPAFTIVDVEQPAFFAGLAKLLQERPVADWRAYLRWRVVHAYAPYLSDPYVDENFAFYGRTLAGTRELRPRWQRAVDTIDTSVGDALGQLYVADHFPPASKARAVALVERLRTALQERLETRTWMDDTTRRRALAKLKLMGLKIGYPEKWKTYSGLVVDRGPYVLNVLKARAWQERYELQKIGQRPDPTEWHMSPATVNAYYSSERNEIVFPAAILQPPFFDPAADDAVNYGAIGAIIGHEMTHGFDDQGRKFDGHGNLMDWWTPESAKRFAERSAVIVRQFDAYVVSPTQHINGRLTEGENIADLGGLRIAYDALEADLAAAGRQRESIDGFTPEQRFFLSYAQERRAKFRPEFVAWLVNVDPHAPDEFRTNGPLSDMDSFARAFNVPEGAPMRRPAAERVDIW